MANNNSAGSEIGIGTLTFLVLVILKATGHLAMSWFWVISSIIWAPLLVILIILIIMALIAFIITFMENHNKPQ